MSNVKSYRQESRIDYGTTDENMTLEQIQTGAILRIADAAEKMANNYAQILSDLDWYKKRYQQEKDKNEQLRKSVASYKGHLTRLRHNKPNLIQNPPDSSTQTESENGTPNPSTSTSQENAEKSPNSQVRAT